MKGKRCQIKIWSFIDGNVHVYVKRVVGHENEYPPFMMNVDFELLQYYSIEGSRR